MPDLNNAAGFFRRICVASAVLGLTPIGAAADDATEQSFESCSRIVQEAERLACYDAVSQAQRQEQAAPVPEAPQPPADKAAQGAGTVAEDVPVVTTPETEPTDEASLPGPDISQEPPQSAGDDRDEDDYAPLSDDVGLSKRARGEADEPKPYRARVTRCGIAARGKYYFFFDNGQVWRQTDDVRESFEDCDFSVLIKKDMFGYKMYPDAEFRPIRIKRVK